MTVTYEVGDSLYLNITNRCPCDCVFCIRSKGDSAYGSDPLWLEREPDFDEIIDAISERTLSSYKEVVFCGFGEPLSRGDTVAAVAKFIKSQGDITVRLNTNGLCDLFLDYDIVPSLAGVIDIASISLNAPTARKYAEVTRPSFGEKSFDAMLSFAKRCKDAGIDVIFTAVDVISKEDILACEALSEQMGIPFRLRHII